MKEILKKALITVKFFVTTYFVLFTITTLSSIQQELETIAQENVAIYSVQSEVYSKTLEYIKFTNQINETRADLLQGSINVLENRTNDLKNNDTRVESESIIRDTVISKYIQESSARPDYEYMRARIVYLVQGITGTDKGSIGTGTVIKVTDNETYVLTNKHVCDWSEGTECYILDNGEKYPITFVKSPTVDIDAQVVKTNKLVPNKEAILGIKDVKPQDKVYVVGHNNGNPFLYSEGTVSGFSRDNTSLIIGMPSGPGNSGSGIFTQDGYITGLLYAGQMFAAVPFGYSVDTAHAICVPSWQLRLFLSDYFIG